MTIKALLRARPVTVTLIGLSVLVGLLSGLGSIFEPLAYLLISQYVNAGLPEVMHGQVWRLITPIFIHFGLMHLVFNMIWLWELGGIIEIRRSAVTLLIMVLVIAGLSNLAQFFWGGPGFGGMSGVVYGLLGYLWMQGRFNPHFGAYLKPPLVVMMLAWFALCWSGLLDYAGGLKIANMAHTVGLVMGVGWGYVSATRESRRRVGV